MINCEISPEISRQFTENRERMKICCFNILFSLANVMNDRMLIFRAKEGDSNEKTEAARP